MHWNTTVINWHAQWHNPLARRSERQCCLLVHHHLKTETTWRRGKNREGLLVRHYLISIQALDKTFDGWHGLLNCAFEAEWLRLQTRNFVD